MRLCERKVLQNLLNHEARLSQRAQKIQIALIELAANAPPPLSKRPTPVPVAPTILTNEPIRFKSKPGRKFKRCCLNRPQSASAAA